MSTSYVTCDQPTLAVVLCSLATGISALSSISIFANILDITNSYSEHVMAISNLAATIPGIVAPYLVGIITNNQVSTFNRFQFKMVVGPNGVQFGLESSE